MPHALHFLVLALGGWVTRHQEDLIAGHAAPPERVFMQQRRATAGRQQHGRRRAATRYTVLGRAATLADGHADRVRATRTPSVTGAVEDERPTGIGVERLR